MTTQAASPPVYMTPGDRRTLAALLEAAPSTSAAERLGEEIERAHAAAPGLRFVRLGALVDVETGGRVRRVRVALPRETLADPAGISVLSPVGAALIGLAEGAEFSWREEDGRVRTVKVLRVVEAPRGDGDDPQAA